MGVELRGIPETTLWTLYMRAAEARRPDAVLDDPKAVELLEAIDFPFATRFGAPRMPSGRRCGRARSTTRSGASSAGIRTGRW
jgi:O-methyltransferase involved in polyketide biosynthesis